jgi:hypothetical protein
MAPKTRSATRKENPPPIQARPVTLKKQPAAQPKPKPKKATKKDKPAKTIDQAGVLPPAGNTPKEPAVKRRKVDVTKHLEQEPTKASGKPLPVRGRLRKLTELPLDIVLEVIFSHRW